MAEKLDVASRLAEGRPAVDNIQTYVLACHVLGYANPDLTLHASQVSDWYGSEDGLDLRALDADCGALEAAVAGRQVLAIARDEARSTNYLAQQIVESAGKLPVVVTPVAAGSGSAVPATK